MAHTTMPPPPPPERGHRTRHVAARCIASVYSVDRNEPVYDRPAFRLRVFHSVCVIKEFIVGVCGCVWQK